MTVSYPEEVGAASPAPAGRRALVVDPLALRAASLVTLLKDADIACQFETASDSEAALSRISSSAFDAVICHVRAAPVSCFDIRRYLAERGSPTKLIVYGQADGDDRLLVDSFLAGAAAVFSLDASQEEFAIGFESVLRGHRALDYRVADRALRRPAAVTAAQPARMTLSPAEAEILSMVAMAMNTAAIAEARNTSVKTIRNHLGSIYRKLRVHSRTQAMTVAARAGFLSGPAGASQPVAESAAVREDDPAAIVTAPPAGPAGQVGPPVEPGATLDTSAPLGFDVGGWDSTDSRSPVPGPRHSAPW